MINIIILSLLCVISALLGVRTRPLFLFNVWWTFWVSISLINILNFYVVSDLIYFLITFSVIVFNLFYIFSSTLKIAIFRSSYGNGYGIIKRIGLLYGFIYVSITSYLIIKSLFLINFDLSQYWQVRFFYFGIPLPGEDISVSMFPSPLFAWCYQVCSSLVLFFFLVFLSKYDVRCIVYMLFCVTLFCILTSGRDIIIYLFVYLVYSFKTSSMARNYMPILLLCIVVLLISIYRSNGLLMVFYAAISYFTGSIVYLDTMISTSQSHVFYFGEVVFSQVFTIFYKVFELASGVEAVPPFLKIGHELMEFSQISDNSPFYNYYNALPTWYYFFFRDFSYFGFIFYPAIIGLLIGVVYKSLSCSVREHAVIMSYIEVCLMWSIFKPMIFEPSSIIVILMYFIYLGKYVVRTNSNYSV
ncbi:hypothetical protein VCSRO177_2251 [Vibrio cholerae]|nr:putative O-antigen polymerase [Vibrio cholerae]GHZ93423.1 hypothetical protein VCSRO177_2251 [Vibrio cholerae]